MPSLGTGRSNGTWMRVRAEVLKNNPELRVAESRLRRGDRQNGTHELPKLWREVANEFSQQLPETLRLMSDGQDARLLGSRASDIAKDVLANILRQRLSPGRGTGSTVPDGAPPRQEPSSGKLRLRNRPRRPPPQDRPPPVPDKDEPIRGKRGPRPPNSQLQPELRKRQDRLDRLLAQRARLQQKANDAQVAMKAPFRKLQETTRKRAQSFLPGGRYSRSVLDKAKVPASMRSSPDFAEAFRKRLTAKLDRRFKVAPTALVTQRRLHGVAALAAREAAKDVQAERDLAKLNEI